MRRRTQTGNCFCISCFTFSSIAFRRVYVCSQSGSMLLTLKLELSLYLAALGFVIYTDTVWLEPLLDGLGTEGPSSACQENVYAKRRKLLEEMCKKYQVEDTARQARNLLKKADIKL